MSRYPRFGCGVERKTFGPAGVRDRERFKNSRLHGDNAAII